MLPLQPLTLLYRMNHPDLCSISSLPDPWTNLPDPSFTSNLSDPWSNLPDPYFTSNLSDPWSNLPEPCFTFNLSDPWTNLPDPHFTSNLSDPCNNLPDPCTKFPRSLLSLQPLPHSGSPRPLLYLQSNWSLLHLQPPLRLPYQTFRPLHKLPAQTKLLCDNVKVL